MRLNKKKNVILIIGIVVLLAGIFVINNQPKETKELPRVKLKEPTKNKQFALMIEQTKGEHDYQESSGELPTEGYKFNKEKSGCVDINGKVVEDALDYDYATYTVLLDTSKTLYCYLYYDIADIKVYASLDTATNVNIDTKPKKYRSDSYRTKIVNASFVDYVPRDLEGEEIVTYWDLTDTSKGTPSNSVIGWLESTLENPNQYNLYIGSKNEIYAIDLSYAFEGMSNVQKINFDNLNTSETVKMNDMFYGCRSLTSLDLSTFDTSKVTNMSYMFQGYQGTTLDLSNFDTSSTIDMSNMFSVSNANIIFPSNFGLTATNMSNMFFGYEGVNLDLSNFNTSSTTDMSYMFAASNTNIIFPIGFGSATTDMYRMFASYQGTTLDIRTFDTSKVTNMSDMFSSRYSGINITAKITFPQGFGSAATDMSRMFDGYKGTELDLSSFDTSSTTDMSYMFAAPNINIIFPEGFGSVATDMSHMFYSYQGTTLDLSNFDTSQVTNMSGMFSGCSNLTTLDLSTFVSSQVTDMSSMFYSCSKLTSLDLSNFDTSSVTNMSSMFSYCSKLATLDLSNFIFDNVTKGTSSSDGNYRTFNNVPTGCEVKINSSQQAIFEGNESKFPLTTNGGVDGNRKFTPIYVD